jgi:isocitrate dehydrogenase kinase/phosphatase
MIPALRSSTDVAYSVARVVLDGFEKHYGLMRLVGRSARDLFERGDWKAIERVQRERIDFYEARVDECVERLRREFPGDALDDRNWGQVKLHYVGMLLEHRQPELAEVFFNTVSCRILVRSYYLNRFIFVRPSVSTDYMDLDAPSYRCYYPGRSGLRSSLERIIRDFHLSRPFADLTRDVRRVVRVLRMSMPRPLKLEANHQLQVLGSLFFRGSAAYVVGRAVNGVDTYPFVVPIVHDASGRLALDAVLIDPRQLALLFSSTRAYFLVDAEVPSTYVDFLRRMLPTKPRWELYAMLGLQKAAKAIFFRDFLHHLRHSTDEFVLAPGTKGLVMAVFTLPSFPYVFKVIRDHPEPPKDVDRRIVKDKYRLVKRHDRVGRMADTLEYSDVAFPRARFSAPLLAELERVVPSLLEVSGSTLFIKHLYIERRMRPLDLYLQSASDEQVDDAMREFGNTLKELGAANIFAGDLLFKNFGVTRFGRVVFYDYDEIDFLTNMSFRRLPVASSDEDEMRGEPWFSVGPLDVFPEEWPNFICTDPRTRAALARHHPDLFDPAAWITMQERLRAGGVIQFSPYPPELRLAYLFAGRRLKTSGPGDLAQPMTFNAPPGDHED